MTTPERSTAVAFFDIGDTLASVRVNPDGIGIDEMVVLPGVLDALAALRDAGVRMGVISNRGPVPEAAVNAALTDTGLAEYLDAQLLVYGVKDSVQIFESAAQMARTTASAGPRRMLFVGEDATERWFAREADFLVCPHVSLAARMLLDPSPLRFLRIRVPPAGASGWRTALRQRPVVPLHVVGAPAPEVYALGDTITALELDDAGFWVDRLGGDDEPLTSDLYLLRDDARAAAGLDSLTGSARTLFGAGRAARRVLSSTPDGLLVAVPASRSVESMHLSHPRHGHTLKLTALPALLDPAAIDGLREPTGEDEGVRPLAEPTLNAAEAEIIQEQITEERLGRDVGRYSGARPIGEVTLGSRHILHPHNARAVEALVADLSAIGDRLSVRTHQFSHGGRRYSNVEAILPGSGLPNVVLVTAHLDSTAAFEPGYQADRDPAPGADDDGSGVAAVLAAARAVLELDDRMTTPRREFRFVLFNAEEQGLVGSRAYARDQAVRGADIVAVLQLDMVGFEAVAERTFELHAGFSPSSAVQKRSIALAELVARQVSVVASDLPAPQVYPAGVDGTPDPAEQRSDHYSFQLNGFPACLASEDFFAGPGPSSPDPDPNPNYHSAADTTINAGYARDIARAVTAAAWLIGTR